MEEKEIGKVLHYFPKAGVAAIKITKGPLVMGDTIHIKGHTSNFSQKIKSMEIEHKPVKKVKKGDSIGIKVKNHVRINDAVFKVTKKDSFLSRLFAKS